MVDMSAANTFPLFLEVNPLHRNEVCILLTPPGQQDGEHCWIRASSKVQIQYTTNSLGDKNASWGPITKYVASLVSLAEFGIKLQP